MTQDQKTLLDGVPVEALLQALQRRGGTLAQVAEAQLLVIKKSEDYNQAGGAAKDAIMANRDAYFPFGQTSYAQMVHVKSLRLQSLLLKPGGQTGRANFEGMRDTYLDLINYASFGAERLAREAAK